jgi:hypothetical protein
MSRRTIWMGLLVAGILYPVGAIEKPSLDRLIVL